MKKVNLRDLYPDVYKTDHFVEVTERVCNTLCYSWSPFSSAAFFIFSSICRSSSLRR